MKVAIVQETIDPRRGGAETSTLEMAQALARAGATVSIVCAGAAPPAIVGEVNVIAIAVHGGKARRTQSYLRGAAEFVCRASFDIVHAVTPLACADVYQPRGGTYRETIARSVALGARSALQRAWRSFTRRFNRRQQFLLRIERELLTRPRPPLVAAVSDYVRRQVIEGYPGFPADRARVVFNGVNIQRLAPAEETATRSALRREWECSDGDAVILFVAHNFKLKGLASLLPALARGPQDWRLIVAGRDNPRPYQRLADALGVTTRVRFVGAGIAVTSLYAASDVLAHPTWYDPCSRVVLEALCCGLPVVTTRHNGAAEVIEAGKHGAVIDDAQHTSTFARALAESLDLRVRTACRASAAQMGDRLSMDRHARELMSLYRHVLDARSAAP